MKKKSTIFLVSLALLAGTISGCGTSKTTTEVKAGENQTLTYAMVTAIEGNEMTYREVDESMVNRLSGTNRNSKKSSGSQSSASTQKKSNWQSQSGTNSKQWQSSGNSKDSQSSDGNVQQSQENENSQPPMMPTTEMPSMNNESDSAASTEKTNGSEGTSTTKSSGTNSSKMSGKTTTVQIPVGVTVHTASNTNTTFSRIRSGDMLKVLLQKDDDGKEVIVGIWMVN